jgi:glycosyltransferase involved in cell wall biosynthesis
LSLPEVGGDAVAYTEPDVDAIARDLAALLADPGRRAALGRAGHDRAHEFTWAASAEGHLASWALAVRAANA